MKKLILVFILFSGISVASFAQMEKGRWMVDGLLTFSKEDSERDFIEAVPGQYTYANEFSEIKFSPGIGYFVKDNLAIGISSMVGYGWGKDEITQTPELSYLPSKIDAFSYGVGVFARNYFPIDAKSSFFAEVRTSGAWQKRGAIYANQDDREVFYNSRSVDISGNVGFQYLVTKKLGVILQTTLLQYSFSQMGNFDEDFSGTESSLDFGFRPSFQLGISFFL